MARAGPQPIGFPASCAEAFRREKVLARTGPVEALRHEPWQPALPDIKNPDLTVSPTGPLSTIQMAVDSAILRGEPTTILVEPGSYPNPLIIPRAAPPLAIIGAGANEVLLGAVVDAQMPGAEYRARYASHFAGAHPQTQAVFERIAARQVLTTGNASVVRIEADDVTLAGLSIENLYACDRAAAAPEGAVPDIDGRFAAGQHQAVALHVAGADRVHLAGLALTSFQDTLYLQARNPFTANRIAIDASEIRGDVDFVFGGATAHFNACRFISRRDRAEAGWVFAPSTNIRAPYGFVAANCRFEAEPASTDFGPPVFMGRQWFEGVRATPYGPGAPQGYRCAPARLSSLQGHDGRISRRSLEAVGKCTLIDPRIGPHINHNALWDNWGSAPWSPRFRPVQASAGDFLGALGPWLEEHGLSYSDLDPRETWLGIVPAPDQA